MKILIVLFALALVLVDNVVAAEPDTRSPYDTNPKCAERTTSATDPECTLQTEGVPRQKYPPGKAPIGAPPTQKPPPAPQPPLSNREGGRTGSGATK